MSKVILYARTGPEALELTDFGVSRGYVPDQLVDGDIRELGALVATGDTLLVETLAVFSIDGWGGAVAAGEYLKNGVIIVTHEENFVLKDDMHSTVLMAMSCMNTMIQTHKDNNRT